MKLLTICLCGFFFSAFFLEAKAQDSLFLIFEHNDLNNVSVRIDKNNGFNGCYPLDADRTYTLVKQEDDHQELLMFSYRLNLLNEFDYEFKFNLIDSLGNGGKKVINQKLIEATPYRDLVEMFERHKKIFLIDPNYMCDGKFYSVRVYFTYLGKE